MSGHGSGGLAALALRLFGGFEAEDSSGRLLVLPTRKTEALFVYLALRRGRPVLRDALATLLWGDRMEAQARASLRQALTAVRQAAGDALSATHDGVTLASGAVEVDALRFERLATSGRPDDLAEAAALYRGELLSGFDPHAPAFDEWLTPERERLRGLAVDALTRLLAHRLATAAPGETIETASRLLAIEPAHEPTHRALMRLLARQERWDAALRQYDTCRDALERTIGVAPDAETEQLRADLVRRDHRDAPVHAAPAEAAAPALFRPSIAVLPFRAAGADEEQTLLAEGIASDLRIELARFRELFVLGQDGAAGAEDARAAGRRLGARFVVEGGFRRAGERVRVTAGLIEVETGQQIWAERWERAAGDLFAVQDELVRRIVSIVAARLAITLHDEARRKRPQDLGAYECFLRGNRVIDVFTPEAQAEALQWFEQARALDPGYARAHTGLAWYWYIRRNFEIGLPQQGNVARAIQHAEAALRLDPDDARVHSVLAFVCLVNGEIGRASGHFERALALNPNDVRAMVLWGWAQACVGDAEAGLRTITAAFALREAWPGWCITYHACVLFLAGRYEESILQYERVTEQRGPRHHGWRAAAYGAAGRPDEAAQHAGLFLALTREAWRGSADPGPADFTAWFLGTVPLAKPEDRTRLENALAGAGLEIHAA